jgi:branched-chain amino acid transport system ATP-binding protein
VILLNIILRVENVSKSFGGIRALVDVSLNVYEGKLLAIVGPNGAGKTTLFNIISGLLEPDNGRIFYMDKDITRLPPYKRAQMGIARIFQIPKLIYNATLLDNIILSCLFGGGMNLSSARARALEALRLVKLKSKADELVVNLTSPERKLLELARAVAMKPRVLLMDEIVAGMPPAEVDNVMSLVRGIAAEEKIAAIAMVEHVMRAVKFADKAVFLHQGRVLVEGPPSEVLNNKLVKEIYFGEAVE